MLQNKTRHSWYVVEVKTNDLQGHVYPGTIVMVWRGEGVSSGALPHLDHLLPLAPALPRVVGVRAAWESTLLKHMLKPIRKRDSRHARASECTRSLAGS